MGIVGLAFNGLFYLMPLVALPLALGFSFYLMVRMSLAFILFHLTVVGLKKLVPTLFINLVPAFLPIYLFRKEMPKSEMGSSTFALPELLCLRDASSGVGGSGHVRAASPAQGL